MSEPTESGSTVGSKFRWEKFKDYVIEDTFDCATHVMIALGVIAMVAGTVYILLH